MLSVALTGGIATGKTYVRRRFEALGVPTIDADQLARDVVEPATPGLARVVERFGPGVLDADGRLDRRALAAIVFRDPAARADLEAIIHPEVYAAIRRWEASLASGPGAPRVAIADIPLLFETGRSAEFDAVIVAFCDADEQVRRVMARDGASEREARARLAAQLPIDHKVARADYVIRTDGTIHETDHQVVEILRLLDLRSRQQRPSG